MFSRLGIVALSGHQAPTFLADAYKYACERDDQLLRTACEVAEPLIVPVCRASSSRFVFFCLNLKYCHWVAVLYEVGSAVVYIADSIPKFGTDSNACARVCLIRSALLGFLGARLRLPTLYALAVALLM